MTRQEFIEEVTTWSELKDFCYDNDCEYCDEVYSEDARDDYINSELTDWARNADSWQDLMSDLQSITTGYDYYIHDDYGEWEGTDDGDGTFEDYKDDVLSWMDENEYWDEEDEDEDIEEVIPEEPYIEEEEDEPIEDEEISIGDLFTSASGQLQSIEECNKQEEQNLEEEFTEFVMGVVAIVEGN